MGIKMTINELFFWAGLLLLSTILGQIKIY